MKRKNIAGEVRKQYEIGDIWYCDGFWYRVREGNRNKGDMVIDISLDGENWRSPPMSLNYILLSFKAWIEENNYNSPNEIKHGLGWVYLFVHLLWALKDWRAVAKKTNDEASLARAA